MFQQVEKFKKDQVSTKNDMNKEIQRVIQDIAKLKDYQAPPPSAPGSAGQTQQSKFGNSAGSMDILTEVKQSMTKLLENKIVDLEFNLNNRIVSDQYNNDHNIGHEN